MFYSGFLDSEPLRETDEDLVSDVNLNNSIMTEEEREEIQQELAKVCSHMCARSKVLILKKQKKSLLYISLFLFHVHPAGRGDQHIEAGLVLQREAACRSQTETGHHTSERAQKQLQQRLARHADLHGVSLQVN